jgi:hypothetical protein
MISEVFDGVRKTVGSVLKTLGSAIGSGFQGAGSAIFAATHAVTAIVRLELVDAEGNPQPFGVRNPDP